jgi:hypothetical protein
LDVATGFDKRREQDGCDREPEARALALLEVVPDERAVDAGADRTAEDERIRPELGEPAKGGGS